MSATTRILRLHDMERATIVTGKPGAEMANCLNGFGDQEANAAEIVKRWNCHDELLAACIAFKDAQGLTKLSEAHRMAIAAIAKATP